MWFTAYAYISLCLNSDSQHVPLQHSQECMIRTSSLRLCSYHSSHDCWYFCFQLVIEAASGAGVAAAMSEKMRNLDPSIQHVGVILCGGNTDINHLPWM